MTAWLTRHTTGASKEALLIPDTNALYANPDLDMWPFPKAPTFTLMLVPGVVRELDDHRDFHRVESIRDRAER